MDIKNAGTNVYKLFEAVDLHGHKSNNGVPKQIAFYDDGVGTETSKWKKVLGSAFGYGLSKNVKQLYADLVRTYEKGDRIYLFGFSRGAFTVRTLAGLIMTCGVIDRNREDVRSNKDLLGKVEIAYNEYRSKYKRIFVPKLTEEEMKKSAAGFRQQHCVVDDDLAPSGEVPIEFIGVWDTVAAVAAPIAEVAWVIDKFFYPFKFVDHKLSSEKKLKKACHALSIDDERLTFHPFMWDEEGKKDDRIEQVWFAGVHSNVGGGYSKHGMSLVSLDWMMTKAEQAGLIRDKEKLRFIKQDRERYRYHRNVTDKLYDSRSGMAVYYRYKPRDIGGKICKDYHIITPKVHNSVIERVKQRTEGYAPGNIPFKCEFVSTDGNNENYDNFIKVFSGPNYSGEKSFLDRVKWLVFIRRISHYSFLGFSLIAVYFSLASEISKLGFISVLGKLISGTGLKQIASNLLTKPFIIIVIIAFYLILSEIRKRMNRSFSEYWYVFWHKHFQESQKNISNPESVNDEGGKG